MLSILKFFLIFFRLNFIDPPIQEDVSEWCTLAENLTSCLDDFDKLQQIKTKSCKWVIIINWDYLKSATYVVLLLNERFKLCFKSDMSRI